jgi:hypothetical protein
MENESDIVALTSYYNPYRFKNRFNNYLLFTSSLARQNIPLITVECSKTNHFETRKYQLKDNLLLTVKSSSTIWHKEHLLNIALNYVRTKTNFKKVVFLDCDITFENENWVREASLELDRKMVIQPFSEVIRNTEKGITENYSTLPLGRDEGFRIYSYLAGKSLYGVTDGDFGFAWGARTELFQDQGLYAGLILGGGDTLIRHCWDTSPENIKNKYTTKYFTKELKESIFNYHRSMFNKIQQNTGHVDGRIVHHYHGNSKYRNYTQRYKIITEHGLNPERDLKVNSSGGLEFVGDPELSKKIARYFYKRNEDNKFAFFKSPLKFLTPKPTSLGIMGQLLKQKSPISYRLVKPFFPDR